MSRPTANAPGAGAAPPAAPRDLAELASLYDRHGAVAFGLALRITGDHAFAEQAVEAAFLAWWPRGPQSADEHNDESALLSEVLAHSVARLRSRPAVAAAMTAGYSRRSVQQGLLPA